MMIRETWRRPWRPLLVVALTASLGVLPASAQDGAGGQAGESDAQQPAQPRPAEMAPRAPHELLLDVEAIEGGGFAAVGARGHVVLSDDGLKWQQSPTPVRATLTAVDFVDDQYGWAVGHAASIIKTEDGGQTWTLQNFDPELEQPFLDVAFFDRDKGFAIGAYDMFYKTEDGGETWTEYEPQLSMGGWHLNAITRLDDGTLVVAGETGLLSKSTDGGETWQLIEAPYTGSLFGLRQLGEQGILLFGLRGHAFVIDDIANTPELPADTDLGYQFKLPPSMEEEAEEDAAESKEDALAKAEREEAEKRAAETGWQVVENRDSVLSLFGGTATADGGYVVVGVNGVIWASDNKGPQTELLPNTREGGLSDVAETPDGDLVLVGENGAFLYRRSN